MADLSEYEALNGIEFSQEVKQLMELFAESWKECRADECRECKYRHGKKLYQLLFCLAERYADKLISNGYAPVRNGRQILSEDRKAECIDRQQIIGELNHIIETYLSDHTFQGNFAAGVVADILDNVVMCQPSADVATVRNGRWEPQVNYPGNKEVEENGKEIRRAEGEEPGETDVSDDDRA